MKCMMAPPVCGFVMSSACVGHVGNLMGSPTYAGQAGAFAVMDPPATWVICSAVHPGLCLSSAYIVIQPVEPSVETAVVVLGQQGGPDLGHDPLHGCRVGEASNPGQKGESPACEEELVFRSQNCTSLNSERLQGDEEAISTRQ